MKRKNFLWVLTIWLPLLFLWVPNKSFAVDKTENILSQVYGSVMTACTRDADADSTTANVLGPFTAGRRYIVYCHDGAGVGIPCECLQGGSTVDATTPTAFVIYAQEKVILRFNPTALYISCVPTSDNRMVDVCPLD